MKTHEEYIDDWNSLHCKCYRELDSEGVECPVERAKYRNDIMVAYCEKMILEAKEAYYKGTPIMEDKTFDWIEDGLKLLSPNSKILEKIG